MIFHWFLAVPLQYFAHSMLSCRLFYSPWLIRNSTMTTTMWGQSILSSILLFNVFMLFKLITHYILNKVHDSIISPCVFWSFEHALSPYCQIWNILICDKPIIWYFHIFSPWKLPKIAMWSPSISSICSNPASCNKHHESPVPPCGAPWVPPAIGPLPGVNRGWCAHRRAMQETLGNYETR